MNAVIVAPANRYVAKTMTVETEKHAKVKYVQLAAVPIQDVLTIFHVSTNDVPILVKNQLRAERMLPVQYTIIKSSVPASNL